MITVTIWHNTTVDGQGRHTAMMDGYQPGDPMVAVFTYQADPAGRSAEQIAAEAFDTFNDHPRDPGGAGLARRYYERRLRSLSAGDVVTIGEAALAVGRPAGWEPVRGGLAEVRVHERGTSPPARTGRARAIPANPRSNSSGRSRTGHRPAPGSGPRPDLPTRNNPGWR